MPPRGPAFPPHNPQNPVLFQEHAARTASWNVLFIVIVSAIVTVMLVIINIIIIFIIIVIFIIIIIIIIITIIIIIIITITINPVKPRDAPPDALRTPPRGEAAE